MKVEVVPYERSHRFSELDQFEKFWMLELPGYVALTVSSDKRDAGHSGIVIFGATPKAITIEWLYVSEGYRGRGAGETLLEAVLCHALDKGRYMIKAHVLETRKAERLCPSQTGYLDDHFFEKVAGVTGEWTASPEALLKTIAGYDAFGTSDVKYAALSRLEGDIVSGILDRFKKKQEVSVLIDTDMWTEVVDPDISIACAGEGKLLGLALFTRLHGSLCLTGLYAEDEVVLAGLLHCFCREAAKKYGDSLPVHIYLTGEKYVQMLSALPGAKVSPGRILTCDTNVLAASHDYTDETDYDLLDAFFDSESEEL